MRPVLGLPIATRFEIYALALYGAHADGNDLNHDERATLAAIGELAGEVWTRLDHDLLRQRIALSDRNSIDESYLTATPKAWQPERKKQRASTRPISHGTPRRWS